MGVPADLHHDGEKCPACQISKHTHHSFPKMASRDAEALGELVHVDVFGPVEKPSVGGARYGVAAVFLDNRVFTGTPRLGVYPPGT